MKQPQDNPTLRADDSRPAGPRSAAAEPLDSSSPMPDGPNVGPSPQEHLAAQGKTQKPGDAGSSPATPAAPRR